MDNEWSPVAQVEPQASVVREDGLLVQRLKAVLRTDGRLHGCAIDLEEEGGRVIVKGTADSFYLKSVVSAVLMRVLRGMQVEIRNEMEVY